MGTVHHNDPETKQESMKWKNKGSPTLKKFCMQQSAGKIVTTVLWDSEGFCFWNSCHTRQPSLERPLLPQCENIKQKCHGKLSAGVLLLHSKTRKSRAAIRKCGFIELSHPPYSPDLLPVTSFSSETLKNFCVGDYFLMTL